MTANPFSTTTNALVSPRHTINFGAPAQPSQFGIQPYGSAPTFATTAANPFTTNPITSPRATVSFGDATTSMHFITFVDDLQPTILS